MGEKSLEKKGERRDEYEERDRERDGGVKSKHGDARRHLVARNVLDVFVEF